MPTIDPALIPSVSAGNLFRTFTEDTTLNIRWISPTEPVLYEVANRPSVDVVVRQLILAKAVDAMDLRLSHQSLFPFLIPCKVQVATHEIETPPSWIWDMHVSLPSKWESLRLAKIKRISGTNPSTGSTGSTFTGTLRLIFTAQQQNSTIEVAMFFVDYKIDSLFTYQILRLQPCTSTEEANPIDPSEAATINGFVTFRTLDPVTDTVAEDFLTELAPPSAPTDSNSDGIFDNPAVYEIVSTPAGGATASDDFISTSLSHGTGITVNSAWNAIPPQDSDVNTFLRSMNYPFRVGATRGSAQGITIPQALFREFQMIAPTPDEATGDVSLQNSPVWVSSIERLDTLAAQLKFTFSTYTIVDETINPVQVEFTTLTLDRTMAAGQIVNFTPISNLLRASGADAAMFMQGFGTGHVVLSSLWGTTGEEVNDFFDAFLSIVATPAVTTFSKDASIISSFGLSRNSRYLPTRGQAQALRGTTERLAVPINPTDNNRFVVEQDQGVGNIVDFRTLPGFPDALRENADIEPVAYSGALCHRVVKLVIDSSGTAHDYDRDILPRLRCLFGRDPIFGDQFWDGTVMKFYSGDAWIQF
jgi:hypothetical protein